MSCPRAARSSSVGTAKSGVPMKIRRSDIIRPGVDRLSWPANPGHPRRSYSTSAKMWIPVRKHPVLWTAMAGHARASLADMMRRLRIFGQWLDALGLLRRFLEFLYHHVALELRYVIDE